MSEESTPQRNPDELGGIWRNVSAAGMAYYTGKLTIDGKTIEIVMFNNDKKPSGSKQPDWRVYRRKPKQPSEGTPSPSPKKETEKPAERSSSRQTARRTESRPAPAESQPEEEKPAPKVSEVL